MSDDEPHEDPRITVEADDDLLTDLDLTPTEISDEAVISALEASDAHAIEIAIAEAAGDSSAEPAPAVDDWLTDVRELARKHSPFAPWQIVQTIRELSRVPDPAGDAGL